MKNLPHITIVLLLITCECFGQSIRRNKENSGGVIAGRITLNGKGVAGMQVIATLVQNRYIGSDSDYKATTDGDGQFRMRNLARGIYVVLANAPTFVVSDTEGLVGMGRPVVVNEGETVEDVNFALVRGAVITGKVTDADGRAVVGEFVRIIPTDQKLEEVVEAVFWQDHQTDDRGVYRVYGLPPGNYKVAVGVEESDIYDAIKGRRIYRQTFHPDVNDEAKAKVVEVHQGAEVSNIDIGVGRAIDGFAASGRVVDAETGQPISGARFGASIITERDRGFSGTAGTSDSGGNFRIDNLPVGKYSISLIPEGGTEYLGETKTFEIVDRDVADLEIKASRGATLTGRIALEGTEDKSILAGLSRAHFRLNTRSPNGFFQREFALNPDGSFSVTGLAAGTVRIWLDSRGENDDRFSDLRIERDGIDQPWGLPVKSGEQITGLRIIVGYGRGTVRGTIKAENGSLLSSSYVYVQLQRQSVSGPLTVRSAAIDANGRFLIESAPPGSYEVVVLVYEATTDQVLVEAHQPVVIRDGAVSEISILIPMKPNSPSVP